MKNGVHALRILALTHKPAAGSGAVCAHTLVGPLHQHSADGLEVKELLEVAGVRRRQLH